MVRKHVIFALGVALFLPALPLSSAFGGDQPLVGRDIQQKLDRKYPNQKIVNACSGKFLAKPQDAVAVLRNPEKKEFLVVWVMSQGGIQELDAVPQTDPNPEFELQCLDAKQAKEQQDVLQKSEAITSSLKVPQGSGAVCYFIDDTTARCWSLDRASGRLLEAGGWET